MWIHTGKATTKNVSLMVYLKCWEAWNTTCGQKAKDISHHQSRRGELSLCTLKEHWTNPVYFEEGCVANCPHHRAVWIFTTNISETFLVFPSISHFMYSSDRSAYKQESFLFFYFLMLASHFSARHFWVCLSHWQVLLQWKCTALVYMSNENEGLLVSVSSLLYPSVKYNVECV